MDYYQDTITQKSWQTLTQIKSRFSFVLIGGWAVWLYTKSLKSKDIDLIVNYETLEVLRHDFGAVKNDRLKKYEAKVAEIDIDIYLPHYSYPGLAPESIQNYTVAKESFTVPRAEILLILKQYAYEQRKASIKGQKDKIDIFSLLAMNLDFALYHKVLYESRQEYLRDALVKMLTTTMRVRELDLKDHHLAKLKAKVLSQLAAKF